jgi:hypothetical protein
MAYLHSLQAEKLIFRQLLQERLGESDPDFDQFQLIFIANGLSPHQQGAMALRNCQLRFGHTHSSAENVTPFGLIAESSVPPVGSRLGLAQTEA